MQNKIGKIIFEKKSGNILYKKGVMCYFLIRNNVTAERRRASAKDDDKNDCG